MFLEKIKISLMYISAAVFSLMLLPACSVSPTASAASEPGTVTSLPDPIINTADITITPAQTHEETARQEASFTLNTNGVAQGFTSEVVAAVSASEDSPYWEALPQYTLLTLSGYPASDHLLQPQIYIFPVEELSQANEVAGGIAASLQTLLENQVEGEYLPFLPLVNAAQVMHAQVKTLDFENGQGVRYLTQLSQGILPINNHDLIYTYQGLTGDGKYYVAAVLPVNLASLPVDGIVTGQEPPEFSSDYPKYLSNIITTLNQSAANAFSPDLSSLDTMIQSIEIR